jgi:anti-sigma B factor antagonist
MSRPEHHGTIGGSLRPRGPIHVALTTRHDAHETVVSVSGELDILTVPRLATTLDDIVRRHQGDVVMDLTRTEFIDSFGLHALLNVQRRLAERARRFTVICGEGAVRHAIELARLTDAYGVVSSLAEYSLHRATGGPTSPRIRPPHSPA